MSFSHKCDSICTKMHGSSSSGCSDPARLLSLVLCSFFLLRLSLSISLHGGGNRTLCFGQSVDCRRTLPPLSFFFMLSLCFFSLRLKLIMARSLLGSDSQKLFIVLPSHDRKNVNMPAPLHPKPKEASTHMDRAYSPSKSSHWNAKPSE
jgi:hypothetical protein